jgi:O-antigen/teichoic acid export membrane protein
MFLSAANVVLRGITMSGRFVLLVALAAYLPPQEIGLFALFSATNQWGIYLQGMEFYLFGLRELVASTPDQWTRRTRDAFALFGSVFAGACVIWLVVFLVGFMPWRVFAWFVVLLVLEQAVQELYRLLNGFGRPLAGSLVLLARSGSWMYVVAVLMWQVPAYRTLDIVFVGWTIGGASALLLALWCMRDLPWRGLPPIDWTWLRRGLSICLPLLAGSLAWRGIAVFERWFVGYSQGESALGVFGFFATIAAAVPVLAESGLGAVLYPKMMKAWQVGELAVYRAYARRMWLTFGAFVLIACPLAIVAVVLVVHRLPTATYANELPMFCVLIASAAVASIAAVPQYLLWARGRDRAMIATSIAGLIATVAIDLVLVPRAGPLGGAWGQLGGVCCVLVLRIASLRMATQAS